MSKHRSPGLPIEAKILAWGGTIVGIIWLVDQVTAYL